MSVYANGVLENRQEILKLLSPQPECVLLDCGCADGSFSLQAARALQTSQVYGVDILPRMAEIARAEGIAVSSQSLNDGLEYSTGFFDVIIANQVIEHLTETDRFVKETYRVLKPGGYVVVSTNNLASWHNIVSLMFGLQPMPCFASNEVRLGNRFDPTTGTKIVDPGATHYRIFSYAALRDLYLYHGFKSVRAVGSGYYPLPSWLARQLCRIDKRHSAYLIVKALKPEDSQAG